MSASPKPCRALLDVNVLIALFNESHVHHEVAHDWFHDHRALGWATCAITENGFLRILSHPAAEVETDRATLFASLRTFCSSGHHEFWPSAVSFRDDSLFDPAVILSPYQLTDAYLLGLAVRHGGALATFDASIPVHAVIGATPAHLSVLRGGRERGRGGREGGEGGGREGGERGGAGGSGDSHHRGTE